MKELEILTLDELYKVLLTEFNDEEEVEKKIKEFVGNFKCEKNPDIEIFLHEKCCDFHLKNKSKTYFILNKEKAIVAYFALAFKPLFLKNNHEITSKVKSVNFRKKDLIIEDDSVFQETVEDVRTSQKMTISIANSILIAQLGRNDLFTKETITLETIMGQIWIIISKIRELIGTNIILIEVDKEEKLIKRYQEIGFKNIGNDGELTQLMKIDIKK